MTPHPLHPLFLNGRTSSVSHPKRDERLSRAPLPPRRPVAAHPCSYCDGLGWSNETDETCAKCNGTGLR